MLRPWRTTSRNGKSRATRPAISFLVFGRRAPKQYKAAYEAEGVDFHFSLLCDGKRGLRPAPCLLAVAPVVLRQELRNELVARREIVQADLALRRAEHARLADDAAKHDRSGHPQAAFPAIRARRPAGQGVHAVRFADRQEARQIERALADALACQLLGEPIAVAALVGLACEAEGRRPCAVLRLVRNRHNRLRAGVDCGRLPTEREVRDVGDCRAVAQVGEDAAGLLDLLCHFGSHYFRLWGLGPGCGSGIAANIATLPQGERRV